MSAVFVDTSAIYAALVATDAFHPRARDTFSGLLGMRAVAAFREGFAPLLDVVWVDAPLHEQGLDGLVARGATTVSLVDTVSFAAMRTAGAHAVFTYDGHFADEGFEVLG